jgi:hypothetical protein
MPDGTTKTVPMARVLDLVRENPERPEEAALLDARRDAAAGMRVEAARKTLDGLARGGSEAWIREYAAATRALLAEQAGEEGAAALVERFLEASPRSRFLPECVLAQARLVARSADAPPKMVQVFVAAHDKVTELEAPIAIRCRILRDVVGALLRNQQMDTNPFFSSIVQRLTDEVGAGDYGAIVLVEAEAKWTQLIIQRQEAAALQAKGRAPHGVLHELKKLRDGSRLDLPEVRSDIERELGHLLLACGEKEGARGAYESARDLAPDPRRREAAEEALKNLGAAK